jgi:hypothetical protein
MSDPVKDIRKEVKGHFSSLNREFKKHTNRLESAFAFDFVPGDPEGDAKRAAEKSTLDQRVRESASRRAKRYSSAGKGVSSILARESLG